MQGLGDYFVIKHYVILAGVADGYVRYIAAIILLRFSSCIPIQHIVVLNVFLWNGAVPGYPYCCTCNTVAIITLRVGGNYSLNMDQIEN
jgi:hypothetical protein